MLRTRPDVRAGRLGAGEAPALALGGMLDSHDLTRQVWLRQSFRPGRYVLHCEMPMSPDAKGGTSYATRADAGMVIAFDIPEQANRIRADSGRSRTSAGARAFNLSRDRARQ